MKLSKLSLRRLEGVHPDLVLVVKRATDMIGIDSPTTTAMTVKKGDNDNDPRTGKWFAFGH